MTPRELRAEVAIAATRRRDVATRDLMHAWHVATFGTMAYVGKLPSLRKVLSSFDVTNSAMTREALEAAMTSVGITGRSVSEASKQAMKFRES